LRRLQRLLVQQILLKPLWPLTVLLCDCDWLQQANPPIARGVPWACGDRQFGIETRRHWCNNSEGHYVWIILQHCQTWTNWRLPDFQAAIDSVYPSVKCSSQRSAAPPWLVYFELAFMTRDFMRQAAPIDPAWLMEIAPHYYQPSDVESETSKKMPKQRGRW
jgi:hypothetical protein